MTKHKWPVYNSSKEHPDYPEYLAQCERALNGAPIAGDTARLGVTEDGKVVCHDFWPWAGGRAIDDALADVEASRKRGAK